MKKIGIRDARARLAELIERAGGGDPVTLTRRGPGRKEPCCRPSKRSPTVPMVHHGHINKIGSALYGPMPASA
ncbi:type II toxin-antitoxin system prevent-host-death family antitoxin [Streptosporangium canum]|uniref:type II toxin-antitoxin system Phd/YefM family antitoxin n=1 Tax=Streptosporangium canum TaxID=324952 RepID=UPI00342188F5